MRIPFFPLFALLHVLFSELPLHYSMYSAEAWKLCPSVIEIIHKNKVPMVMKSHRVTHTFQTQLKG